MIQYLRYTDYKEKMYTNQVTELSYMYGFFQYISSPHHSDNIKEYIYSFYGHIFLTK